MVEAPSKTQVARPLRITSTLPAAATVDAAIPPKTAVVGAITFEVASNVTIVFAVTPPVPTVKVEDW
jgi:hypothetical protein